jgi:hypothetical protein
MKKITFAATVAFAAAFAGEISAASSATSDEGNDSAAYEDDTFNGLFFGIGAGYGFSSKDVAKDKSSNHEVSKSNDRFIGTMAFGAGRTMSAYQIYYSCEILADIAKSKHSEHKLDDVNVKMRNNGITSSLAFRLGLLNDHTLFFFKAGTTYAKSTLEYNDWKLTNAKLTPFFGVGVEKPFGRKISLRGDLEYRCDTKKTNDKYELKRGHTVNVRVLAVYHVKY